MAGCAGVKISAFHARNRRTLFASLVLGQGLWRDSYPTKRKQAQRRWPSRVIASEIACGSMRRVLSELRRTDEISRRLEQKPKCFEFLTMGWRTA